MRPGMTFYKLLILANAVSAVFIGPYIAQIQGLQDNPPLHQNLVDFIFYIQQVNITYRVVTGYMTVKKGTGTLYFEASKAVYHDGEFVHLGSNSVPLIMACHDRLIITKAILASFRPAGGFDFERCSFKPGEYSLQNIDINELVHMREPYALPYGRALYILNFYNELDQLLFGFRMDIDVQNLEIYEFENGRGKEYSKQYQHNHN